MLRKELLAWDGKSADDIGAVYQNHASDPDFIADILDALGDPPLQKGATWLVKKHLDSGCGFDSAETGRIYCAALKLSFWESRLHLLQCIPLLGITVHDKSLVETFLRSCLNDPNRFIRAWAYGGFVELAVAFSEFEIETRRLVEYAMRDETPSVTARLRNAMKNSNWS
jgi:hypothetical protein